MRGERLAQPLGPERLDQVIERFDVKRGGRVAIERRVDDDLRAVGRIERCRDRDAVPARHLDVQYNQIGSKPARLFDRGVTVPRRTDDLDVGEFDQRLFKVTKRQRLVIHY